MLSIRGSRTLSALHNVVYPHRQIHHFKLWESLKIPNIFRLWRCQVSNHYLLRELLLNGGDLFVFILDENAVLDLRINKAYQWKTMTFMLQNCNFELKIARN